MATKIIWHDRGVYLKYSGDVTFNDVIAVGQKQIGNPRFDNCIYEISDFTEMNEVEASEKEINILATLDKTAFRFNNLRYSIIIIDNEKLFSLADLYLGLMEKAGIKTYRVKNISEVKKILTGHGLNIDLQLFA